MEPGFLNGPTQLLYTRQRMDAMPTEEELYQQVLAAPHDDAPRLTYADWLTAQGDIRGEFIRLQCELDGMSPFDDRWSDAVSRERRLFYEHGADWNRREVIRRGFVSGLNQYQPAKIDEWGPDIFGNHPIDFIWFYYQEKPGWGKSFAECEFLKQLRTIWIGGRSASIESSDLFDMLASPHLADLDTFCITGDSMEGLGPSTFPELINHGGPLPPALQQLRALSLNLWGRPIMDDSGMELLVESDLGSSLTCLCLKGQTALTPRGLTALAGSSLWTRLQELDLDFQRNVPDVFDRAWSQSRLQRLRVTTRSDQFERLFLTASRWGELTHLDLGDTVLPLEHFRRFVEHSAFSNLRELHIDRISCEHIHFLASAPHAAGLRSLTFGQDPNDGDGLIALSRSSKCNRLCELNINHVTPEGIKALVESKNFSRLHTLSFNADELDECLDVLAEATNLPVLTNLQAYSNSGELDENRLNKLLASPCAQRLSYIDVIAHSEACHDALRQADQIVWLGSYCTNFATERCRKHNLYPNYFVPPTPRFFSWKPPI
ncbi:MAG: TIGR02996 domain-containing protein [Planctomycetales bacterium]|nr:TIGR02996 domain-containing protein [Planctomycetales bacterium]